MRPPSSPRGKFGAYHPISWFRLRHIWWGTIEHNSSARCVGGSSVCREVKNMTASFVPRRGTVCHAEEWQWMLNQPRRWEDEPSRLDRGVVVMRAIWPSVDEGATHVLDAYVDAVPTYIAIRIWRNCRCRTGHPVRVAISILSAPMVLYWFSAHDWYYNLCDNDNYWLLAQLIERCMAYFIILQKREYYRNLFFDMYVWIIDTYNWFLYER